MPVLFVATDLTGIHYGNNKIYWVKKHYMETVGRCDALKYIKKECPYVFSALPSPALFSKAPKVGKELQD